MKTALVIGASGLVGGELVKLLSASSEYSRVILLSRRPLNIHYPKTEVRVIDFDSPDPSLITGDVVFCAIGTTIKKAGSKEAQRRIDLEYPLNLARIALKNGAKQFVLVSSLGADHNSSNFYLRTKGELEKGLTALNFPSLVIIRPSLILGNRSEFRFGEKMAVVLMGLIKPLMFGNLKRYRGVQASAIAAKMVSESLKSVQGSRLIQSESI